MVPFFFFYGFSGGGCFLPHDGSNIYTYILHILHTHFYIAILSLSLFLSITCGFVDRHQSSSASSSFYPSGAFLSIFLFHFSPGKLKDRFYISVPSDGPNSSPGDRKTRTLQRERALARALGGFSRPVSDPGRPRARGSYSSMRSIIKVELLSFDDVNVFIFILFILFLLFFYF